MQRAEARFLRALYYYYAMDLFGNVPFITTNSLENAPQAKRSEVFTFIENELLGTEDSKGCIEDMADPKTNTYGRADKATAWVLLARLYLNAKVYTGTAQWEKAAEYAEKAMKSAYTLCPTYKLLFMGDNNVNGAQDEVLLPILQDGIDTQNYGGSLFLIASTHKDDMGSIGTSENWAGNRARPDFVAKFFPNGDAPAVTTAEMVAAAGDDRALLWGKDRTLSVDDVADFASGYSVAKFTNYYTSGTAKHSQFPDTDYFLMRAAEAYLTFAEADTRANGGSITAEAKAAIDAIRNRANAAVKNTYSLNDILDEWSREFYYEGRRRIDLIRFGQFGGNGDYKWQWKSGVKEGTVFNTNLNIFAIPDTDLNANPNLVQNPGY